MNHLRLFILFLFQFFLLSVNAQEQSLTLRDAIKLALENNRNLKVTALDISRAQQQTRLARSEVLPSVNLSGQYAHYFARPVFFGFGGDPAQDGDQLPHARIGGDDQFLAAVTLVQPLYNPAARPELQRARLAENTSRLAHRDNEIELTARVKQIYLSILVLNERLNLQNESLARNKKVLHDARLLFAQGRALRVDTLRAYTTVKNLQPDILKLTNAIATAKLQLITLLGLEDKGDLAFTDSLFIQTADVIPTEEQAFEEAKKNRPDLQILSLEEQISRRQVSIARAGMLPTVSFVGQYQLLTQVNDFKLGNAYWPSVSFAGAQLTIPLFNGYSNSARMKEAKLATTQSAIQQEDAVGQLRVEIHDVIASLHETAERLKTQTTVRETAQLSYDITQYRYEKGMASRLELTDAELALTTAQLNYLEAVYDCLSAHIQLELVVGENRN